MKTSLNKPPNGNVFFDEREFDEALLQDTKRREASENSWSMYSGFDYGQWSKQSVSDLKQSNRHIAQYNFIRGKIDGLAGSIVKNWYDIDFVPVSGDDTDTTQLLKGMMYSDKELLDWDNEYMHVVVDGLIHRGVEQMIISEKYNPLGNIGFERIMPEHVILDPNWKSHSANNLTKVWKIGYYDANQLKNMFPGKIDRIDEMVMRIATQGIDYQDSEESSSIPYFNLDEEYGSKKRVIECHYIKEELRKIEIIISKETGEQIELPQGTPEEKADYLQANEITQEGGSIKKNIIQKVYYVKTFCPELDSEEYLQNKVSEIQIGRLPFFPWSSARINGRDSGVVDLLIDAQQSINKKESLSEHMISTAAHGAKLFDPSLFGNDHAKSENFKANINRPDAIFETAPGALMRGANSLVTEVPRNQYSGEIANEISRMMGHIDIISRQTAALEGRNESDRETGTLFARKQLQSEIAQTTLTKGLQQHWNDKGEAYMMLAQSLYTGPYREIRTDYGEGGKKVSVGLNIPQFDENGMKLLNSLADMPRHKVIVSQSPQGITTRTTERAINAELLASIPPELSTFRAQITKNIMQTLEIKAEEKEQLLELADLEMAGAIERVKTEIVMNKGQQAQMQQQLQAQQQQMQVQQQQAAQGGEQQQAEGQEPAPQEGAEQQIQ